MRRDTNSIAPPTPESRAAVTRCMAVRRAKLRRAAQEVADAFVVRLRELSTDSDRREVLGRVVDAIGLPISVRK